MFEEKIFWKDGFDGEAKGGIFSFLTLEIERNLNKFVKEVEEAEKGGEVVGIKFEDNNLELIVKK